MPRYIDADALKESLKELEATGKVANPKYLKGLQDAIDGYFPQIIDDEPTADVEPVRHGRWYANNLGDAVCSNCKGIQNKYEVVFMPYCPNCGARMDGDAE